MNKIYYCDCNLCKKNSKQKIIYWKKSNIKIQNIIWKKTSLITWQGLKNNNLICIYYLFEGCYIRTKKSKNAIKVNRSLKISKLFCYFYKCQIIVFMWKLCLLFLITHLTFKKSYQNKNNLYIIFASFFLKSYKSKLIVFFSLLCLPFLLLFGIF